MTEGNDGNEQPFSRAAAEHLIAQSFIPHVLSSAKTVWSLYSRNEIPLTLTDAESHALHKYSYFGWTAAVVSGLGTFTVLFGGLRYGSYLMRRRPSFQFSQPSYHAEMAQKRAKFSHLDNPTTAAATTKSSKPTSNGTPPPSSDAEKPSLSDTAINVQFLLCSAVALLSALAMGNKYSGAQEAFPENLAQLPLQKGTSIFCERYLCPAVMEHHRNLLEKPITYEKLYDTMLDYKLKKYRQQALTGTDTAADSDKPPFMFPHYEEQKKMWHKFDHDPSLPTPNEVYQNAATETAETAMMEAVQRLLYNCECRQAFAQHCRRSERNIDPITDLVIVPESGVPLKFVNAKGAAGDIGK